MAKEKETVKTVVKINNSNKAQKGMLFSTLDHAEEYTYNGETCMITPKGKIQVEDVNKVGQPLRPGLMLRKID